MSEDLYLLNIGNAIGMTFDQPVIQLGLNLFSISL